MEAHKFEIFSSTSKSFYKVFYIYRFKRAGKLRSFFNFFNFRNILKFSVLFCACKSFSDRREYKNKNSSESDSTKPFYSREFIKPFPEVNFNYTILTRENDFLSEENHTKVLDRIETSDEEFYYSRDFGNGEELYSEIVKRTRRKKRFFSVQKKEDPSIKMNPEIDRSPDHYRTYSNFSIGPEKELSYEMDNLSVEPSFTKKKKRKELRRSFDQLDYLENLRQISNFSSTSGDTKKENIKSEESLYNENAFGPFNTNY